MLRKFSNFALVAKYQTNLRKYIYLQHKRPFFTSIYNRIAVSEELEEIRIKYKNGDYDDAYDHLRHVFEQAKKSGLTSEERSEALTLSAKVQLKYFRDPDLYEIEKKLKEAIECSPSNQEAKWMLNKLNIPQYKKLSP